MILCRLRFAIRTVDQEILGGRRLRPPWLSTVTDLIALPLPLFPARTPEEALSFWRLYDLIPVPASLILTGWAFLAARQ